MSRSYKNHTKATSYKVIRLILQPLTFHYITALLYVLTSLFSYKYLYTYSDYNKFNIDSFKKDLEKSLSNKRIRIHSFLKYICPFS